MSTGMMALYVIVAGLAGVGLLVGGFLFMRRKTNDSELDINDDLLEKDNVK
jgi:LPXTG-motif cell wall-anchored protein